MELTFDWYGVKQMSTFFARYTSKINNYKEPFEGIAKDFYKIEEKQFQSEGGRKNKWQDLNPKYAEWKNKNYPGRPILVLSGDLRKSLISEGGNNIKEITKNECKLGTKDPKGKWHYLGSGRLPVRRPIDLTDRDKSRWFKIVQKYVMEMAYKLGYRKRRSK